MPRVARFAGQDNVKGYIQFPFTLNEYDYCYNEPVDYIDPDGNIPTIAIGAIAGGLIGGVGSIVTDVATGNNIDWERVGKNAVKGAVTGAVVGTGVGLAATAFSTEAAVLVGVSSTVGATTGGVASAMTGGSVINGICGGAVNGAVSGFLSNITGMGGQFVGGALGSLTTDAFDEMDNSGTHSGGAIASRALVAGLTQSAIVGPYADAVRIAEPPLMEGLLHAILGGYTLGFGASVSTSGLLLAIEQGFKCNGVNE